MANWYGTSRSNYFAVKDRATFNAWAESRALIVMEDGDLVGINPGADDGGWPSDYEDEDTGDLVDFDLKAELAPLIQEGQIVVLVEAGAENLRYVTGYAIAFNHTGEFVEVSLSDIYKLAAAKFGREPTAAEY